jgi:hypothetical protein
VPVQLGDKDMKSIAALIIVASALALSACEEKTPMEKVENKVNDAMDNRPGEPVRDAAEDVKDSVKDATN